MVMRIKSVDLSWFRGAGCKIKFTPEQRSTVIYGPNGSGKSTFVDAIEYLLSAGKKGHLAHEYSGTNQVEGTRNIHAPEEEDTKVTIDLDIGYVLAQINHNGGLVIEGQPPEVLTNFQKMKKENLILRQDEVANFVHQTKGMKYSALLPLIGLQDIEVAVDNVHRLRGILEKRSEIRHKKQRLGDLEQSVNDKLSCCDSAGVFPVLRDLAISYGLAPDPDDFELTAQNLIDTIRKKIESHESLSLRLAIQEFIQYDIVSEIQEIKKHEALFLEADSLLYSKIGVLENSFDFVQLLGNGSELECPACGRIIDSGEFQGHVKTELEALNEARATRQKVLDARVGFNRCLHFISRFLKNPRVEKWLEEPEQSDVANALDRIDGFTQDKIANRWTSKELEEMGRDFALIVSHVQKKIVEMGQHPDLLEDLEIAEACNELPEIERLKKEVRSIDILLDALKAVEDDLLESTKTLAKGIITGISNEVQSLWAQIHPGEPVEDVKLYVPHDAPKSIDISLKFYGKKQPSPRLTLSEGHRNSLGLCIFLALALQQSEDTPIILDDIVSSLDREHRSGIGRILKEKLVDRQVLLFTHDRGWYSELRFRLPPSKWNFMVLRPFTDPATGICWSGSLSKLDEARDLLDSNIDSAGNRARASMDTNLSIIAESLRISMHYLRGEKNDKRTGVDFISRIRAEGKKRFKIKREEDWISYEEPINNWEEARSSLLAWGNPASHGEMVTHSEVEDLISICEKALDHFECANCQDYVWAADLKRKEILQCSCGNLVWKYG
jgi:energy-coupling factor transporter ATP-binding protein EcfA2